MHSCFDARTDRPTNQDPAASLETASDGVLMEKEVEGRQLRQRDVKTWLEYPVERPKHAYSVGSRAPAKFK